MGTLGRSTRNGKRSAAPRVAAERPHPAVAKLAVALKEHKEALEQQAATAEILQIIGSSPTDAQPVFDAIARNAMRLLGGFSALVTRRIGDALHLAAFTATSKSGNKMLTSRYPVPLSERDRQHVKAVLTKCPAYTTDYEGSDVPPAVRELARARGYRSALTVPMICEGEAIGTIAISRREPGPFSTHHIELLKTFAAQAVIAIENVRHFNETKEALERQTATAEILKVISGSPADVQPVFEAIAKSAFRLVGAFSVAVTRRLGDELHLVAFTTTGASGDEALKSMFPVPLVAKRPRILAQAVLTKSSIHVPDTEAHGVPRKMREIGRARGYRSSVVVPMIHDGEGIGTISVTHREAGAFSNHQIDLLKTFADQAVIAIENARLFNETKEALEHQKASADILRIVASSVESTEPVFRAITEAGMRLVPGCRLALHLVRDGHLYNAAHSGVAEGHHAKMAPFYPIAIKHASVPSAKAIVDKRIIHIADIEQTGKEFALGRKMASVSGWRAILAVPLMRGGEAIGNIAITRPEPGLFTDKQVVLIETFADQALVALENARLFNETKEALEHQKASTEVLRIVARSVEDTDPVFEAITAAGMRLVPGARVALTLVRDGEVHYVSHSGVTAERRAEVAKHFPLRLDGPRTIATTAILEKRIVHVSDMEAAGNDLTLSKGMARVSGFRAMLAVPLMREGKAIGTIAVTREQPGPFTDKQIELVKTFADQAVIAIRNATMFREIQDRNAELKQSLEFQGASGEILASISSSVTDTKPVFDAIVRNVVRLLGTRYASLFMLRGDQLELAAVKGSSADGERRFAATFPQRLDKGTLTGKALLSGKIMQVAPIIGNPGASEEAIEQATQRGYNALIVAPMTREDKVIGAIATVRNEGEAFDEKQVALLKTFADQAVIAIENVRLFNETKEALERQTATAEILGVISSTPTSTQPVFEAIVEASQRLIAGGRTVLLLRQESRFVVAAASRTDIGELPQDVRDVPLDREKNFPSRAILDGQVVHVPDWAADDVPEFEKHVGRAYGIRSGVIVPLLRKGEGLGALAVARNTVGPYHEKEIALLRSFADQAVIAIENVRLFNETKESLEQQTAISEILRVISTSPSDVQPVLDAVAERAARICGAPFTDIVLVDDGGIRNVAGVGEIGRSRPDEIFTLDRTTVMGRSIIDRVPIHLEDLLQHGEEFPRGRELALRFGHRTIVAVPLLREGKALGTILARRTEVRPFDEKHIALLKTFADQAAIAIENVRLFNETKKALEQQTATSQVLGVISSSPTDVVPTYRAILDNVTRLCEANIAALFLYDGEFIKAVAHHNATAAFAKQLDELRAKPSRGTPTRLAALERRIVHVEDALNDPAFSLSDAHRQEQPRTVLSVPLLRDEALVGVITIWRREPRLFSDKQVALVRTFADQALIAIENVRLFNETKEALERQTATAEILKVIAGSPADVQPVFEAIAQSAMRLCDTYDVGVALIEGNSFRRVVHYGPIAMRALSHASPLDDGSLIGRTGLEARTIHVADVTQLDEDEFPSARYTAQQFGFRTALSVPLLRAGQAIGVIFLRRQEVRPFTDRQIALLELFASQAVIAIENARLFNETKEALERQTATTQILQVISNTPANTQPVFDAIVQSTQSLMSGKSAALLLRRESEFFVAAYSSPGLEGMPPEVRTVPLDRDKNFPSRVILDGEVLHIPDWEADEVPQHEKVVAKTLGLGSGLQVPLLREGQGIGALVIMRQAKGLFHEKEIALLRSFADQAVIAIENARLINETKEALEQQTATAQILKVIAGSQSDLNPVMAAVVENAARLSDANHALIGQAEGDNIRWLAAYGCPLLMQPRPITRALPSGRAMLDLQTTQIEDVAEAVWDPNVERAYRELGVRSIVAAPLVREGRAIGVLLLRRTEVRRFSDKQVALLNTFADQAAIAIENVRLFNETKEALERQTATAEILKVISDSPTDVQPVFDAILARAAALCNASFGNVFRYDGSTLEMVACNLPAASLEILRKDYPSAPTRGKVSGRVVLDRKVVEVPDVFKDPDYQGTAPAAGGHRSLLGVPLLREGQAIGAIVIARHEPGKFTPRQVAMVQTFADQAVIAIENVRLFNETKEALEQQTATAEILKVISSSPTDEQPVFDAIVQSLSRLFERRARLRVLEDGRLVIRARSDSATAGGAIDEPLPIDRDSAGGRVALDRIAQQFPDTEAADAPPSSKKWGEMAGYRAIAAAPLVREGNLLGVISVTSPEPGALTDKQMSLLQTFAGQAVIAIENVRLFNETKEALEQQTAISEVLRVISNSPTDVKPVLDAVAMRAARICEATDTRIFLAEGEVYRHAAGFGDVGVANEVIPLNRDTPSGRAMIDRVPQHIHDMAALPADDFPLAHEIAGRGGWRTILSVPLLREDRALGTIVLRRKEVRHFSEKQIALLKTFADQAAIAIENVRLFKELHERTEALTKSVSQLTALGEVGQAITSTLDLETVLKTIVQRAVQLTGLDGGSIYEYDERTERFTLQAAENMDQELVEAVRRTPVRKGDGTIGQSAVTLEPVQAPDILDKSYHSLRKDLLVRAGYRAILAVPLLREGHTLGAILVNRRTPGPFAPEVVELLKTFATQSAMAIQNARLFREIAEKGKQLEVASRHKSDFLASMSHELRTPLNALLGFNELIMGEVYGEVPTDMKPPLAQMQSSGKHLLGLINNVLDLAKIEAGRMELALSDYSVHDIVESVRSTLRPLAQEKGLDFLAEVPADIPLAHGDPGRITQCLMNLAGNSLKFTKAGKVAISVALDDGRLRYCVADTGIGIQPEKIDSLFTEFKQTDATIASEYGGTGLGLSISKKFVELHGGRIWVESQVGQGSAFSFEVPLRAGTA